MSELRFDDRVVIVTGAGSAPGSPLALALARRGAMVVASDGPSPEHPASDRYRTASDIVNEIIATGGEAVASPIADADGERLVETALDNFGRVDIVIHNASIVRHASFETMTEEDWNLVYDIHVKGAFLLARAAWPHMRSRQYGRLLFTSSAAHPLMTAHQPHYRMAALALTGFSQGLAREGLRHNILSNVVALMPDSPLRDKAESGRVPDAWTEEDTRPLMGLCAEHSDISGCLYERGMSGWNPRERVT